METINNGEADLSRPSVSPQQSLRNLFNILNHFCEVQLKNNNGYRQTSVLAFKMATKKLELLKKWLQMNCTFFW